MPKNQPATSAPASLKQALEKNKAIQGEIEQSADELCLVNVVLEQEVPHAARNGEVALALQKTGELEDRMQTSADELAQVNQSLKQEIRTREHLERELKSTQAALAQMQGQSQGKSHAQTQAQPQS